MMVTVIALVVLLISILFIKSTIIITLDGEVRTAKVNVFLYILCSVLAFVPFARWFVMFGTPIIATVWFGSDGFDRFHSIELSDDTFIGKILLFKI